MQVRTRKQVLYPCAAENFSQRTKYQICKMKLPFFQCFCGNGRNLNQFNMFLDKPNEALRVSGTQKDVGRGDVYEPYKLKKLC